MNTRKKYAFIGILSGLANGLFGSGGGLFLVPFFTRHLKMEDRKAFATSIAVILPLSLISAFIYFQQNELDIQSAFPYLIGGAVGGFISSRTFNKIPTVFLKKAFAVLILYGGIRAVLQI
jgi:Predicted permeases